MNNFMKFLTQHEKQKAYFAQEEATNKMYKWSLMFIAGYFILQVGVGIIRLIFH